MRTVALLAVLGCLLVPAAPSAAVTAPDRGGLAEARRAWPLTPGPDRVGFTDLGCYDDPFGDVLDAGPVAGPLPENPEVVDVPEADLVQYCVGYRERAESEGGGAVLGFTAQVLEPTNPLTDPAWLQVQTFIGLLVDVNGDDDPDLRIDYGIFGGELAASVVNFADGTELCRHPAAFSGGIYQVAPFDASCLGSPAQLRVALGVSRQEQDSDSYVLDIGPNDRLYDGPLARAPQPAFQCPGPDPDEGTVVTIVRVRSCVGGTEPVSQAVAVSEATYNTFSAASVILARADNFADALAGSGLAFGLGPVLYAYSPQDPDAAHDSTRLPPNTRAEIIRVLPRGQTVYLMGGTSAISAAVEQELIGLDYRVTRFAGAGREETAALVADEVRFRLETFASLTGFPDLRSVIVATRNNWPDAVVAGSISSFWGMPILLTDATTVHPATQAALEEIQPEYIYVIGGSAVISVDVLRALRPYASGSAERAPYCPPFDSNGDGTPDTASNACRVGGSNRVLTALGVGELNRFLLAQNPDADNPNGSIPPDAVYAAAINLFRADGFAHALSATSFTGAFGGAAFIPLSGDLGDTVDTDTEFWICEFLPQLEFLFLMGDTDLVSDGVGETIRGLLEGRCTT